jgi:hypothetical protein
LAIGMAGLAMLAGCASSSSTAAPDVAAVVAASGQPASSSESDSAKSEVAALAVPTVEREPVRLVGMTPTEVERLLGRPRFVRHDGQAQIWRFANQSCVLDVFFYREAGGYAVRHYELRSPGIETASRPCAGDVRVLLQAQSG